MTEISREIPPTEWAYLGSKLEGATISASTGRVTVALTSTNLDYIKWLKQTFTGSIYRVGAPRKDGDKQVWGWRLARQVDVKFVLENAGPWVRLGHKKQANLALAFLRAEPGKERTDAYAAMSGMNHR